MAGWILLVGCSVRCLTVKTSAPLHPRRAHPAELLPRRRQARPSTLGVLPHREGDAVDPLTSSPNSLSPSRRESRSAGRGRRGVARAGAVRGCGGGLVLCSSRCAFCSRKVHFALEMCS